MIKNEVMKAAEQRFSAEFRNRIDQIVIFSPLTMDEVRQIAVLYLGRLRRQMEKQGKVVEITDRAIDLLTEKGFSPTYGARFLKRHIDEKVKLPITNMWKGSPRFVVDAENGEITIKSMGDPNYN
jgi:ATP-dependent Clp protease ATP-binding subunit ClpA